MGRVRPAFIRALRYRRQLARQSLADRRTAWRGAVPGLLAGVAASAVFGVGWLQGPYDALQDKLFPAPEPSDLVTVCIPSASTNA